MTYMPNLTDIAKRDGFLLHQTVPADRWCVTLSDLVQFRRLVQSQVANRSLQPTEGDHFNAFDNDIGPSIHIVNRDIIMPITEKAGNMSWALMLHTDGLKCDLFVTHCWQEGLYEFIDKVLCSWPRSSRHAYCCMFSNPQNLEIGQMISSPRHSPFAQALSSASHMLVVPNARCSIYTRIWCCYEAYLAYSESKIILTASAPVRGLWWEVLKVLAVMVVGLLVSVFVWPFLDQRPEGVVFHIHDVSAVIVLRVSFFCVILASLVKPSGFTKALVYFGAVLSAADLGWFLVNVMKTWRSKGDTKLHYGILSYLIRAVLSCLGVLCAEADRHWRIRLEVESSQLLNGYTRRLQDAESSQIQDKVQILQELAASGVEEDVNMAINVLLTSGMSTPTLRTAACRAGTLKEAGYWNLSLAVLPLLAWLWFPTSKILNAIDMHLWTVEQGLCDDLRMQRCHNVSSAGHCDDIGRRCAAVILHPMVWISIFIIVQALSWAICFVILRNDKRGFAVRVLVWAFVLALVLYAGTLALSDQEHWEDTTGQFFAVALGSPMLALAIAGPGHTSKLPLVGPGIVRILMWHPHCHWHDCGANRKGHNRPGEFDCAYTPKRDLQTEGLPASVYGMYAGAPDVEL